MSRLNATSLRAKSDINTSKNSRAKAPVGFEMNAQLNLKSTYHLKQFSQQLYRDLSESTLKHWLKDHKVAQKLDQKIQTWAFEAKSNLDQQHPFLDAQQKLEYWLEYAEPNAEQFQQMLQDYQNFNHQLGNPDLTESLKIEAQQTSWSNRAVVDAKAQQLNVQLLKDKWLRKLTQAIADWEFEQLALQRDAFLEEMKDFLATLQKMSKHKDSLGLDTGIFIDYSAGKLSEQDVQQFEQWCQYLEHDQALLQLCQMLGSAQPSQKRRKALSVREQYDVMDQLDTDHVHEEIVGLKLAQTLSMALPSELALLADPDLDLLFDLKYLESNLMSFNMQGQDQGRVIQDPHFQKQPLGQKGPMIVCLDTSGSMHGQPELIAKAIVLFLATQAMQSKRALYLINFSTNLTALNLKHDQALDELIHFLSQSFHGGTDIVPAIEHVVSILKQPQFQNADVVVVSDFIMGQLGEELMKQIQDHKQQGNGFYAVAIGNLKFDHLDAGLFDHQWIYQSQTGEVVQAH